MPAYIALLWKEKRSHHGVSFPDFPGCVTAGKTLDEARRLAREALELHVRGMAEDGDPLPAPSTLDAVMADRANHQALAFLVDVPDPKPSFVRVNITVPEDDLARIDDHVREAGTTRSTFLVSSALERLARAEGTRVTPPTWGRKRRQ